jgi:signal transduction histidine kinase
MGFKLQLSARGAAWLFLAIVIVALAQATWWIIFMATLTDEKVEMAEALGADSSYVEQVHEQEISRQIMLGYEGVFFLLLVVLGAWLIYRALVRNERLKVQQENFLLAVTHELKTPLASLRLYLDTLESEKIPVEKKQTAIPRMRQDTLRLESMVDNILEAVRFEQGRYDLRMETIDLSQLAEDCLKTIDSIPLAIPKIVDKDIAPGIKVRGDWMALKRAFCAVSENALKYHNGHEVHLSVRLKAHDGTVKLEFQDHGIGLTKEDAAGIFERFYRVGNEMTRRYSGSGLGLYLCREILHAHGGDITARSAGPGKGTTFTITLKRDSGA